MVTMSRCGALNDLNNNHQNQNQTAPTITSAISTSFVEGAAGSFSVSASGNPSPTLTESGALPGGITFSGGSLSGTPTATGQFPITFTATNGVSPNATQSFTLSVNASGSGGLAITTTSPLPQGTTGTAYNIAVSAPSGTTPYTWTIAGTLPAGLSVPAANGAAGYTAATYPISGTPTAAGTSTVTVTVTDSENPAVSVSAPLTITIVAPGAACTNDSSLTGGYAVLLEGWANDYPGEEFTGMIGSFQANGAGSITAGTADINDAFNGPTPGVTFTGTYCLNSNNLGTITIALSTGESRIFAFSLQSDGNGNVASYDSSSSIQGSGLLRKQQTTAFSTSEINGNYVFALIGVFGSPYPNARDGILGVFSTSGNGSISAGGQFDESNAPYTMAAGSISVGSNGHGTAALDYYGSPLPFTLYVVSPSEILFLVSEQVSAGGPALVAGQVIQQVNPSFSGNMIIASEAYFGSPGPGSQAQVGFLSTVIDSSNGDPAISVSQDVDNDDVYSTAITETADYTVATNGRISFANSVCTNSPYELCLQQFVPYLTGPNTGFILGTGANIDFGKILPQVAPAGGFTNASLNGNYFGGSEQPTDPSAGEEVASVNFDGIGTLTGVSDQNSSNGPQSGSVGPATYTVSPDGRVLLSGGGIIYIVSPTRFIVLPGGSTDPYLIDAQQ
jgi:hypothetical protein